MSKIITSNNTYVYFIIIKKIFVFSGTFEPFLRMYLNKFKYQSIETSDFKEEFLNYFVKNSSVKDIDWNAWLNNPGMPPVIPEYDRTLVNICQELKDKWLAWNEKDDGKFTSADIANFTSNQFNYFLQLLLESDPISISKLKFMDKIYGLSDTKNMEIKFRWIRIGLKAQWSDKVEDALKMVTEIGRMKFVRPLYQDLYKWEDARSKAIATFEINKKDMMHVSAYTVRKDLHLDK